MALSRVGAALVVALAALVAALPAAAKEGVTAKLESAIPLAAASGTQLTLRWRLASRDEDGTVRPFSASAVFVRLLSKTGAGATTGVASGDVNADGRYAATVDVPVGGIRDVQVGLRGFTSGANGTHNADVLFPIANDPLPGVAKVVKPASGTRWLPWLAALLCGGALFAVAALRRANVPSRGDGHGRQGARGAHPS
jgi:hypothetical protein